MMNILKKNQCHRRQSWTQENGLLLLFALFLNLGTLELSSVSASAQTHNNSSAKTSSIPSKIKNLTIDDVRNLQGKMKKFSHLKTSFIQTRFTALRGKSLKRHGNASFSRPNIFRWTLEDPKKDLIFDGEAFFEYDPDAKSAVKYSPTGSNAKELSQIVDLVLNFDSLLQRFDLVDASESDKMVKIHLKPKKVQEITSIELIFDLNQEYVTMIELNLQNKNKLTHDFSSPERTLIPPEVYKLPKDTKISSVE